MLSCLLLHTIPRSKAFVPRALGRRSTSFDASAASNNYPIQRIEKHFQNKMQRDNVPLLRDFATYSDFLPVKQSEFTGAYYRLCDNPYFAKAADIARFTEALESREGEFEPYVKYSCSPAPTGKTSGVLVGFLESAEKGEDPYTHYLYLACEKSNKVFGYDDSSLSQDLTKASNQGAAFMYECIQLLLQAKQGSHFLAIDEDVRASEVTIAALEKYLRGAIPEGRILVHVDEHKKMCRHPILQEQSASFRRAAMTVFTNFTDVSIIATYRSKATTT